MKVVRLSALGTGRLYPPGNIPGTHFCYMLSQPQGHSMAGRIMSMKNPDDPTGSRTREFPACSSGPQPTAPPLEAKYLFPERNTITRAAYVHQDMCIGLQLVRSCIESWIHRP
jgi:hypothetical protein